MTEKWHGGKGDRPRPINNRKQFDENWKLIFGKLDNENTVGEGERQETPTMDERPVNRTP